MNEADTDVRILLCEMCSEMLCAIDRAVLASGTAEADHQIGEAATAIGLHMRIDHTIYMLKEAEHFPIVFQELYHRLITACQFLVWFVTSGIVDRAAVKHIAATVSGRIVRHSLLERETVDLHFQHTVMRSFRLKTRQ